MKHVQIIIGSVRPVRVGEQVGEWVLNLVSKTESLSFEIVDLKDWPLPLGDEPDQPAHGQYIQEHTKAWSRKISSGDGYIFVTPQYNWGYPAALKNALDHLYKEWSGKPAVIISYGHRGGVKAAAQLRQILDGLHMKAAETMPALTFQSGMLDEKHQLANMAADFAQFEDIVVKSAAELSQLLRG